MKTELNIKPDMFTWAIARAGYDIKDFVTKFPKIQDWLEEKKKPTVKQLEAFSKKVYLPFGYLFLPEPPQEILPIPFFRTNGNRATSVSINVFDTISLMQRRQDWLRDYLRESDFNPLPFVGRFSGTSDYMRIV